MYLRNYKFASFAFSILIAVSACATPPDKIDATYISPLAYESYSCEQLAAEAQRVSSRAAEITGVQKKKAQGDAAAMAVGLVLFWPALLFIKGDSATETEVARLKGEMEAVEKVSIQKECGFQFQTDGSAESVEKPTVITEDSVTDS